jgi:hypothetical protein
LWAVHTPRFVARQDCGFAHAADGTCKDDIRFPRSRNRPVIGGVARNCPIERFPLTAAEAHKVTTSRIVPFWTRCGGAVMANTDQQIVASYRDARKIRKQKWRVTGRVRAGE